MKDRVLVGRVGKSVGRDGKHRIFLFATPPDKFPEMFYSSDSSGRDMKPANVAEIRKTPGKIFAVFGGKDDMTGKFLFAEKWRLKEGAFWIEELIGCEVKDVSAGSVGRVMSVETNLPQVWLNLKNESRNFAIPFVRDIIKKVAVDKKIILAEIPAGMETIQL
ncbi:MAG: hypothetical protein J7L54_01760 [Elusimicrobia bacterium]|nr:hypothetical protein [Elusimicrobiota bacterium]